jgi:hypothetical protein
MATALFLLPISFDRLVVIEESKHLPICLRVIRFRQTNDTQDIRTIIKISTIPTYEYVRRFARQEQYI